MRSRATRDHRSTFARRLHERGARVALAGLEPDGPAAVAQECGGAPWVTCDVANGGALPDPAFACRIVIGGISALVSAALIKDEADQLRAAAPKVVALLRHLSRRREVRVGNRVSPSHSASGSNRRNRFRGRSTAYHTAAASVGAPVTV